MSKIIVVRRNHDRAEPWWAAGFALFALACLWGIGH